MIFPNIQPFSQFSPSDTFVSWTQVSMEKLMYLSCTEHLNTNPSEYVEQVPQEELFKTLVNFTTHN